MSNWIYHPYQKPQIVSDEEYPVYLQNGWFKNYMEIPGYIPDEHGENVNDSDEYYAQFEEDDEPVIKKRGRPPKSKKVESIPVLHCMEESQGESLHG